MVRTAIHERRRAAPPPPIDAASAAIAVVVVVVVVSIPNVLQPVERPKEEGHGVLLGAARAVARRRRRRSSSAQFDVVPTLQFVLLLPVFRLFYFAMAMMSDRRNKLLRCVCVCRTTKY
jgi:hypothetical protein